MLPQTPGYYFWFILDWSYFEVGAIHVSKDTKKHLEHLSVVNDCNQFYVYKNDNNESLTMYHDAWGGQTPHLPPMDENKKPLVDGYVPFDFYKFIDSKVNNVKSSRVPPQQWLGKTEG